MKDKRVRDTGRGREKMAPCREPKVGLDPGTRSWDSRITSWAEGRRQTAEPSRDLLF